MLYKKKYIKIVQVHFYLNSRFHATLSWVQIARNVTSTIEGVKIIFFGLKCSEYVWTCVLKINLGVVGHILSYLFWSLIAKICFFFTLKGNHDVILTKVLHLYVSISSIDWYPTWSHSIFDTGYGQYSQKYNDDDLLTFFAFSNTSILKKWFW